MQFLATQKQALEDIGLWNLVKEETRRQGNTADAGTDLNSAFRWSRSRQGYHIWNAIHTAIRGGFD